MSKPEATEEQDRELLQQIAAQCKVVAHLATALAKIHSDYEVMYRDDRTSKPMLDIAEIVGPRTASFMDQLGDMLNALDAASEDDEWTHPIFQEAQRRWPTSAPLTPTAPTGASS